MGLSQLFFTFLLFNRQLARPMTLPASRVMGMDLARSIAVFADFVGVNGFVVLIFIFFVHVKLQILLFVSRILRPVLLKFRHGISLGRNGKPDAY